MSCEVKLINGVAFYKTANDCSWLLMDMEKLTEEYIKQKKEIEYLRNEVNNILQELSKDSIELQQFFGEK